MGGLYTASVIRMKISKSLLDAIQGRDVGRKHVDRDPAAHDMITITRASRGARVTRACEYESENFADGGGSHKIGVCEGGGGEMVIRGYSGASGRRGGEAGERDGEERAEWAGTGQEAGWQGGVGRGSQERTS